ncbi:MAG: hypothetical protein GYB66_08465 [Chloroflexi bacterium]|nr:hypothetical protein [Chloroflexota bacterium]
MATVAIIQRMHQALNAPDTEQLSGLARQLRDRFFEVLVEESGHVLQTARSLDDYLTAYETRPDLVICAPFPETGNVAPGFTELKRFQVAFPDIPVIVWSQRQEAAIKQSALEDYGVAHYYTGNLIDSPDDFADLILAHT